MDMAAEMPANDIRQMTQQEFLDEFCLEGDDFDSRWAFAEPFERIYDWAESAGATSIVVGGSFVTEKKDPGDIDLLVFFKNSASIRKCSESMFIKEVRLDIQLLAEDQVELTRAFLYLLGTSKSGQNAYPVQIKLHPSQSSLQVPSSAPILYEQVRDSYEGRVQIHVHRSKGLIIPIHGINTRASWLQYFSLMATSSGWGFAPFVYGREWLTTLANPWRRKALVEEFRIWLNEVRKVHDGPVCIFGHSLGSYLFSRYLASMGDLDERFCGVVFAGSIVGTDFDWQSHIDGGRVAAVQNTYSPNDFWVSKIPEFGMYGRAGAAGFRQQHERLQQVKVDLLSHTNMFDRDLIERIWMPFFEYSLRVYKNSPTAIRKI